MVGRFIKVAFLVLIVSLVSFVAGNAEEVITPNSAQNSEIVIEPIEPVLKTGGVWEVDGVAILQIKGQGVYEIIYYVDNILAWSGKAQLPYNFKTTFRGLKEGFHVVRFELEDKLGNVTKQSIDVNVKH